MKLSIDSIRTGLYGRNVIIFTHHNNDKSLPSNSITSGDIVGVTHLNERNVLVSGVVLFANKNHIEVAFDHDIDQLKENENLLFNIIKLANDVTHRRLKAALNNIRKNNCNHLVELLFGETEFREPSNCEEINFFNPNLNQSQKEAVQFALSQPDVGIIHGPPGTGKTTTLIELILQCVRGNNLKVLACAPSNVAVDNILEKLVLQKQENIVRLGHPARAFEKLQGYSLDAVLNDSDNFQIINEIRSEIDEIKKEKKRFGGENIKSLRKDLKQREKKALEDIIKNCKVVLSTLTTASPDGPLKDLLKNSDSRLFDVIVIDECSQALEAACWIALPLAKKCILAGDHLQLPPTIISDEAAKKGLEKTLMERLIETFNGKIVRMLNVQYRMNQNIMNWSSKQLYDMKLIAHETVENHTLNDIVPNVNIHPLLLIDTAGCDMDELDLEDDESKGNEYEADLVTVYVDRLISLGFLQKHIGIISPYNLQVELLRKRISKKYENIEIKSVDGFQGREKEIIILSLVRSNAEKQIGFLSEKRRINVAVTRAKRHLAVICDSNTVSNDAFIDSLIEHITNFGDIISAYEFKKDIECLESVERPTHLRYKESKNTKVSNQSENIKSSKPEYEKKNQMREKLENKIQNFILSDKMLLEFPKNLSAYERRVIHAFAEKNKLHHESKGEGDERYILIEKKLSSTKLKLNKFDKLETQSNKQLEIDDSKQVEDEQNENKTELEDENKEELEDENKNEQSLQQEKTSKQTSTKPKKMPQVKEKQSSEEKKVKKKSKNQNLKSEIKLNDDDDFDTLIAAIQKSDKTCSYVKCKSNIAVLGQHCQFCNRNFCLTHNMPEIHGCGDSIRAFVKKTTRKEGKILPGSGIPERKKDPVMHQYLERKLAHKIDKMSNDRKSKKS